MEDEMGLARINAKKIFDDLGEDGLRELLAPAITDKMASKSKSEEILRRRFKGKLAGSDWKGTTFRVLSWLGYNPPRTTTIPRISKD